MGFLLRMNGTTDKLEIPQFQFDKVILDIMVTKKSDWGKYWSSNYGWFQKNSNTINDQWDTSSIAMVYKNGVPQTNLTPFVDIGERAVFTIETIKIVNSKSFIFSHMGFQIQTGGEIYNIKYYLGDTLQAHYDMNTGTVQDKSGNGFDGILTGGTWIDNSIKVARLYNDGRLAIKGNLTVIPKARGLITDGLVMHLDADNENSIVKDGSNRISEWKDLSGYANHAMQVNTNEQPLLNVNAMNGRNTIKLNGSQHLSVPPSTALEISPYLSIFAVVKLDSHGKEFNVITNKETNWNNRNWWLIEWNRKWVFRQSEAGSVNLESDVVSTTNPTMIGIVADGSRINMFIDGLPQSGYMDYSYLPTQSSMVGIGRQVDYIENRNWVGDIGEILIYNTFLTEADRKSTEQYLGEKWLGWDADNEEPVFNLKSNGDLEIPIELILGGEGFSITNKQIKIKQIIEGGV